MRLEHDAATIEEKLSATMGLLRALETNPNCDIGKYIRRYSYLSAAVNPAISLPFLRDHAVELARTDIFERVEES